MDAPGRSAGDQVTAAELLGVSPGTAAAGTREGGQKTVVRQPRLTDDDRVFEQATTMLWNPLAGPDLRAALYKVLAVPPNPYRR